MILKRPCPRGGAPPGGFPRLPPGGQLNRLWSCSRRMPPVKRLFTDGPGRARCAAIPLLATLPLYHEESTGAFADHQTLANDPVAHWGRRETSRLTPYHSPRSRTGKPTAKPSTSTSPPSTRSTEASQASLNSGPGGLYDGPGQWVPRSPRWTEYLMTTGMDLQTTSGSGYLLRVARPEDYDAIAAVVDDWWGRPVLFALPRFFLDYFHRSSLVATDPEGLAGFLVGFLPEGSDEAHGHLGGVAPRARGRGLARAMHEKFSDIARRAGRSRIVGTTSPTNTASVAFHP